MKNIHFLPPYFPEKNRLIWEATSYISYWVNNWFSSFFHNSIEIPWITWWTALLFLTLMFLQKIGFPPHKHKQCNKVLWVVRNHICSNPVSSRLSCHSLAGVWQQALFSRPYDRKEGEYVTVLHVPVEASKCPSG